MGKHKQSSPYLYTYHFYTKQTYRMNDALCTMHWSSTVLYSPQEGNLCIQVYRKTLVYEQQLKMVLINYVILKAFYPLVLMVSHKFGIYHKLFISIQLVGTRAGIIFYYCSFILYALQCHGTFTFHDYLGITISH